MLQTAPLDKLPTCCIINQDSGLSFNRCLKVLMMHLKASQTVKFLDALPLRTEKEKKKKEPQTSSGLGPASSKVSSAYTSTTCNRVTQIFKSETKVVTAVWLIQVSKMSFSQCCFFKGVPELSRIYWIFERDGTNMKKKGTGSQKFKTELAACMAVPAETNVEIEPGDLQGSCFSRT